MEVLVNRAKMAMPEIEKSIADLIKKDLGAKKVSVLCKIRHWEGHTCPEFSAVADGVKIKIRA